MHVCIGILSAVFSIGLTVPAVGEGGARLSRGTPLSYYKGCNIVFVSFDALQAAHVGILGYPRDTTPTIDAMAKRGYSFTRATSVASWTVPASMTWFTGVFPSEHRIVNKFAIFAPPVEKPVNLKELSPDLGTLAEVLRQNGYATGGFTGNAGVSGGFGYEQGFDVYYHEKWVFGGMDQSIPKALNWLSENKNKKLFLFLHGYDIHGQHTPTEGYDYRFVEPGYDKKYTGAVQEQEMLREMGLEQGKLSLRDDDVRFWRAVYDEKIQRTDAKFRKFLDAYDRLGLTNKTIFVLTSDHGTELYEHRRFDHGYTLYQEQIHVPLIITLPEQKTGTVVRDRISSIDLMPTLLDLAAVDITPKVKKQMRGSSLVPAMRGESRMRDVFSETDYREYTYKRSIIDTNDWKLIYTLETKTRELYDLKIDHRESHDLASSKPQIADALERRLFAHFKSIGHDLQAKRWDVGLNPVYASQAKGAKKK